MPPFNSTGRHPLKRPPDHPRFGGLTDPHEPLACRFTQTLPHKGPAQNSVAGAALMRQPSSAFRARLAVEPRFRPTTPNAI
ncbi:hypothetical protein, partial [Rhizobium ruizarguesonis]|uniref:hypothetical protein n=1 Tax=Rhizobium ruizarguesonis TaxID=2081791 RepID=UPI001A8CD64D